MNIDESGWRVHRKTLLADPVTNVPPLVGRGQAHGAPLHRLSARIRRRAGPVGLTLIFALLLPVTFPPVAGASSDVLEPVDGESEPPMCPPVTMDVIHERERPEPRYSRLFNVEEALEEPVPCIEFVYPMTFPLALPAQVTSPFAALRDGGSRRHLGVDLPAPKMTAVRAVAAGTVLWVANGTTSRRCCSVAILHEDGWKSVYAHLNNDTLGTDDGLGMGVVLGLRADDPVVAGQVIGYVGDSGNAEPTTPHLHFELITPEGEHIDAASSLVAAFGEPGNRDSASPEGASTLFAFDWSGYRGAFADDDLLPEADSIDLLASRGLVGPCDALAMEFCPTRLLTVREAVEWLMRAGLVSSALVGIDYPVDQMEIERVLLRRLSHHISLAELRGCGSRRLCADQQPTLGEAAALLAVSFDLAPGDSVWEGIDQSHPFAGSVAALRAAGGMSACRYPEGSPIDLDALVSRAWFASALQGLLVPDAGVDCTRFD